MDLDALIRAAAEELGGIVDEEEGIYEITLHLVDEEAGDAKGISRAVTVYGGEEAEAVIVTSEVGPYSEDVDLAEVLRLLQSSIFSRVYLAEADDDGIEPIIIEAGASLHHVSSGLLSQMMQEVAEISYEVENFLFDGSEG